MSAVLTCDSCNNDITDGVSVIAHIINTDKKGIIGKSHKVIKDFCIPCCDNYLVDYVRMPKFTQMLVTKIGIHRRE